MTLWGKLTLALLARAERALRGFTVDSESH